LASDWPKNPWHRNNNNTDQSIFNGGQGCDLPGNSGVDAYPELYDICSDISTTSTCNQTLNCLGQLEKAYVQKIVAMVRGNTGGSDNVIFEVINEARTGGASVQQISRWHDVVGYWVKGANASTQDDYLVSASIFSGNCSSTQINQCGASSCSTACNIFFQPNIDIVDLHSVQWSNVNINDVCPGATAAINKFGKPVITDDDGGATSTLRNDKCKVEEWASSATTCGTAGRVHFNHLDGISFASNNAIDRDCAFNPGSGSASDIDLYDDTYLDCFTLDTIGDSAPTRLAGFITTSPSATCPHFTVSNWCSYICPATLTALSAEPSVLEQVDGNMVEVQINLNSSRGLSSATLTSIDSNETLDASDIKEAEFGTDDRTFKLRAKKNGTGPRYYRIMYRVVDSDGVAEDVVTVVGVPK
jgi:hypothetical protein